MALLSFATSSREGKTAKHKARRHTRGGGVRESFAKCLIKNLKSIFGFCVSAERLISRGFRFVSGLGRWGISLHTLIYGDLSRVWTISMAVLFDDKPTRCSRGLIAHARLFCSRFVTRRSTWLLQFLHFAMKIWFDLPSMCNKIALRQAVRSEFREFEAG